MVSCERSCALAGVPHNWQVGAPTRKSKLFSNLQLFESLVHTQNYYDFGTLWIFRLGVFNQQNSWKYSKLWENSKIKRVLSVCDKEFSVHVRSYKSQVCRTELEMGVITLCSLLCTHISAMHLHACVLIYLYLCMLMCMN